jgi:FdhD protein
VPRAPLSRAENIRVAGGIGRAGARVVPEEVPVALVYDGTTHAVMMASPCDIEDFATGFSLTEGKIARLADLREIEVVDQPSGIEARIWLAPGAGRGAADRRRAMLGPTGCGLCGIDSLAAALPALPVVVAAEVRFTAAEIVAAVETARPAQGLNREARALHAAGFWSPAAGLVALREDVGRHNALDKLVGALLRAGVDPASGILVLTSRVSVEMVQKAAVLGAPVLVAVSAPTALALATAEAAGITVAAVARGDEFEIFTRPDRIATGQEEARIRAAG